MRMFLTHDHDDGGFIRNISSVRNISSRVEVTGWGKTVAQKAARCHSHPLRNLAREGRGWVEVSIVLHNTHSLLLPPRHDVYNNVEGDLDEDEMSSGDESWTDES